MNEIVLDQELRTKLNGLTEQVEVRDEAGRLLGRFVPLDVYKKILYESVKIPFSKEEIERRRNETGGCSLAEFWKKMGVT